MLELLWYLCKIGLLLTIGLPFIIVAIGLILQLLLLICVGLLSICKTIWERIIK